MKTIKIITVLVVTLLTLSSCSDDDNLPQNEIVGKWNKYKATKEYQNGRIEIVNLSDCDKKEIMELRSDSKVFLTKYSGTNCSESRTIDGTYTYDKAEKSLILPGNNGYIVDINGNEMNLKFRITGIDNFIKTVYFKRVN